MARIVLVHGAFNELGGPHELKARWMPALRDGLWHHGVTVDDDDVGICFYGDLFRRDPTTADETFTRSRAGVAEQLAKLAGTGGFEGLAQAAGDAAFERTVDLLTTMATTPDLRENIQARMDAAVTTRTTVIVAHSLGTIVAYHALRRHPEWAVHTLLTLGSPLAQPVIASHLDLPAGVDVAGRWPGGVQRWVNVAAVGDPLAAGGLAGFFGERVEDVLVDNGHRRHDPEPYLNSAATGAAVAAALT